MVVNRQTRVRVAPRRLEQFLARVQSVLSLKRSSATVCLVTDAQIAKWNRVYRGKPKPTDVLSFPADEQQARNGRSRGKGTPSAKRHRQGTALAVPKHRMQSAVLTPEGNRYLGDIAIAPAVALRNARRAGRSLDNELRVLILHGVLHLLGYDHETDRGEMERLELRLRRSLEIG